MTIARTVAGTLALTLASGAYAQHAAPPVEPATTEAAPGDDANATLGDIVVTAQRRSERLSDVPISITAQTGADLTRAGITNVRELGNVVPGLSFTTQGTFAQPTIRGVQSSISLGGSDNPIAIYVDGFYQPNQVGNIFDLPDIARVEVLKGPQGTLFGRNATGGAITLYTRDPTFETTGDFTISDGVFVGGSANTSNEISAKGFVSLPLVDDVIALSVSGYYDRIGGYLTDDLTGRATGRVESYLGRVKLLIQPAPGVRLVLSGFYDHRHDDAAASAQPLRGNTNAANYPDAIIATEPYHVTSELKDSVVPTRSEHRGLTLRGEFDIGDAGTLTSLTGYTRTNAVTTSDIDGAFAPSCPFPSCLLYNVGYGPEHTFQQELSFASRKFGAFSVVGGAFYYHDDFTSTTNLNPPLTPDGVLVEGGIGIVHNEAEVRTRAYAGFGEVNWDLTGRLRLIGGVRYNVERKRGTGQRGVSGVPFAFGGLPTAKTWTPRASIRYALDDRTNVYATYSRGFKSGVLDSQGFTNTPALPESIDSFEIGAKTGSQRFNLSVAGFLYEYKDLQVQFFNGTRTLLGNAANARLYGVDLDATAEVLPGLQLRLAGSWLPHAKYRDFPTGVAFLLPNGPSGMTQVVVDASGRRLLKAPKLTGSVSANYLTETGAGKLELNGTIAYSSPYDWELTSRVRTGRYAMLNTQVALTPTNSRFRVAVFGKNLTNVHYISGTLLAAQIDGVEYSPPRQLGVSLGYAF